LFDSMTVFENVAFPLREERKLDETEITKRVEQALTIVDLLSAKDKKPAELSGGMRKRAGLARAMALDPEILFFDEPSAGLDPVSSRRLDELILELRDSLGATVVIVTHELASVFAIGDDSIFLDAVTKTLIAHGNPKELLAHSTVPEVRAFLTRGAEAGNAGITSAAP
jgi:phospholipid/cholesterol/gamma-HCH transport system ATP-binding protein